MLRRGARVLGGGVLALACTRESPPLRLVPLAHGGRTVVGVTAPAGTRINARLAPALEFADGHVVRLDRGAVDRDSAYFTEAPWSEASMTRGTPVVLRASVCDAGEARCRTVRLAARVP